VLQTLFTVLLTGVLTAAVACFAVIGAVRAWRTRALGGESRRMGFRFSAGDPFDVPRRYADFALISSGHSRRAGNVGYGRMEGQLVRVFDFRYEVGHGTQRLTRYYKVILIETSRPLPRVLMWHDADAEAAPLQARPGDGHVACWSYHGNGEAASLLAGTQGLAHDVPACLEANATGLMVFLPARGPSRGAPSLEQCLAVARALEGLAPSV